MQKTEIWIDNLGKWTTKVNCSIFKILKSLKLIQRFKIKVKGATVTNSNENIETFASSNRLNENTILFEIHVELHDDLNSNEIDAIGNKENLYLNNKKNKFREGWIIYRSIKQFENLHESLSDLIPQETKNKFKKIPNLKPGMITKNFNEEKIKQATHLLDDYLRVNFFNFGRKKLDYIINKFL